jgi:aminoglycoside 6'-N-acetyltransferase
MTDGQTVLKSGQLLVRLLTASDARFLSKWLSDPAVLEFYEGRDRPLDLEAAKRQYLSKQDAPVTGCIVEWNGEAIGFIQCYPLDSAEKAQHGYAATESIYGMDQFLGEPKYWDRGIGTFLVSAMADYLCRVERADKVVVDPQVGNPRAVRCYEKSGFRKVRILPQHEMHEGRQRDCWLMEFAPATTGREPKKRRGRSSAFCD